ncbi:MAG: hypothetical protein WCP28_15565 [Actinomycetes bacterium]
MHTSRVPIAAIVTGLLVSTASLVAPVAVAPSPAMANSAPWSQAARYSTTTDDTLGYGSPGAFAPPGGSVFVGSVQGLSVRGAGSSFPAPTPFVPVGYPRALDIPVQGAFNADGSGYVMWRGTNSDTVRKRASDGSWVGAAQGFSTGSGPGGIGVDAAGDATVAYYLSRYNIQVMNRAAAASTFTVGQQIQASSSVSLEGTLVGLVVDPNGAAVLVWLGVDAGNGVSVKQAVRPAGSLTFGTPTTIATGTPSGAAIGHNSAGRAVLGYYDGGVTPTFRAAIREPGGAFSAAVSLGAATTNSFFGGSMVAAVAESGNAALIGIDATPRVASGVSCPGPSTSFAGLRTYQVGAASTVWSGTGTTGFTDGSTTAFPVLAGGPGNRIEAAWWEDPASTDALCQGTPRQIRLMAGTLGGTVGAVSSMVLPTGPGWYQSGMGTTTAMALNGCGDGALAFGWNPSNDFQNPSATKADDGLYAATMRGCTPAVAPPVTPPVVAKGNQASVGVKGTLKVGKSFVVVGTTNARIGVLVRSSSAKVCKVSRVGVNWKVTGKKKGFCTLTISAPGNNLWNPLSQQVTVKVKR